MTDNTTLKSAKTLPMLKMVGFYDRYGTVDGREYTLNANDIHSNNALDASARLCTAILLSSFPEYQCDVMAEELARISGCIEADYGPFDPMEMHAAMDAVLHG